MNNEKNNNEIILFLCSILVIGLLIYYCITCYNNITHSNSNSIINPINNK